MSSSTPLLSRNSQRDNLPIFLRVCHSPWELIGQQTLVFLRSLIAAYMVGSFVAILHYELEYLKEGWMVIYKLENISYLAQLVFYLMTAAWSYMHLYYPHEHEGEWQTILSPPQRSSSSRKSILFSYFYTFIQVFPHLVTMLYWLVMAPHDQTHGIADEHRIRELREFTTANLFGVNSGIALFETFFLSSIKRQKPACAHSLALGSVALAYTVWIYVGKWLTGKYVYYFFENVDHSWKNLFTTEASFIALIQILFAVVHGLTGIRETVSSKDENTNGGYSRLPQ